MKLDNQANMYIVNPINTGMQDWDQTNISIIIPAYNCHNTIVQTLASIAMQENIHEIETIIADDCSDNGYDEIAKIFSNFMKIKIVRLLKGGGPGTARQVGYDHSVGSYVMFMDGDDSFIGCDAVNILKKVMIEKEQDCVYGQFLEQSETGDLLTHEIHMVWMFGKLYRRSFLEHYNIRMNMSHSNEDTGYNCVVKGCSNKIWYIPKPVYTWRFKPNSITRFNNGMYGSESGMCGYLTNMIWQIKELEKRFVNKNYILEQTISIMCVLYHFYIENMQRYPLGSEANLEWIRYYYEQCYKPYEHLIEEATLNQIFARVAADQNVAGRGIIPKITFFDFMKEVKSKPYNHNKMHDVGGSVIEIPQTTPENYPVEVSTYFNLLPIPKQDTNTNLSRMDGMQRVLEDDKKQRAEFLEDKILPHIKKEDEKDSKIDIDYPISYEEFVNAVNRNAYDPFVHSASEPGIPLPHVYIDDGTVAAIVVPEHFLIRYYRETGKLLKFSYCKDFSTPLPITDSRLEFLTKYGIFEDGEEGEKPIPETPGVSQSKINSYKYSDYGILEKQISYSVFKRCINELKYIPALSTTVNDVPLPYVIVGDKIAEVPESYLYRYFRDTGDLMKFDFCKDKDGAYQTRSEFLSIHDMYEDENNIAHICEIPNPLPDGNTNSSDTD